MKSKQVSLLSALLFLAAAQFWIVLILIVDRSVGFGGGSRLSRWTFATAILIVATVAIHRLLPPSQNRLALAALLAGAILVGAIGAIATIAFFRGLG